MDSQRTDISGDRVVSFGLPGSVLQPLKTGLDGGERSEHRFPRRDQMDIPQATLAARLHAALVMFRDRRYGEVAGVSFVS